MLFSSFFKPKYKFKYFRSEAESINKRLCEQSAIANRNKAIAAEINNVADTLYNEAVEVENEESVLSNNKKINIKRFLYEITNEKMANDSVWMRLKNDERYEEEAEVLEYLISIAKQHRPFEFFSYILNNFE